MKTLFRKLTALLTACSLAASLALPAAASDALGQDLTAKDTLLNQQTQLSTNVFWSESSANFRTENLVTYEPNERVTPIVTYGAVVTEKSTVSAAAQQLEAQGKRVVAAVNGDFYVVSSGVPVGLVITDGLLRSSDGGFHAIGFRADGTALLGKPGLTVDARFAYTMEDGTPMEIHCRPVSVNKDRNNTGVFLYTYDFNAAHTTGSTQPGVDVVCTIQEGDLALGGTTSLLVERIAETGEKDPTPLGPGHLVLSANAKAGEETLSALRSIPAGTVLTLSLDPADPGWTDVQYAVGSLYSLVEDGAVSSGLTNGAAPRTAVGQRYDGSLVFYTIDGRRPGHSIGATMDQVARRLIELGCADALCLDGGGSTTLTVTKPTDHAAQTVNRPSDPAGRSVSNQIFLVADSRPSGELDHFHVSADHPYVLAGSSVSISAAAIDTNYIPMDRPYELSASAGDLIGDVLATPLEGGDITVTAEGGGGWGSTVVHAVSTPDAVAVRDAQDAIIASLEASPGDSVQLHGSAAWRHLPLKADPAAFSWALEGDIGTIDQNGLFQAEALGTGRITVSAGDQSASIDVTVAVRHLEVLEDFEGGSTIFRGSGEHADFSLSRDGNYVRMGRASGRLAYDLTEGPARWYATAQPAVLDAPYTGLTLWVDSNGSGNALSLLYSVGEGEVQSLPLTTLDVSGWKQVSLTGLPTPMTIRGLEVTGSGNGVIYLDQLTATFDGIVDNAPPQISAELDPEGWAVTGTVTDAVDGILPASAVTIACNGAAYDEGYDASTGRFRVVPAADPGGAHGALRITVTARDASGNIGRTSVDIPAAAAERRFTDTADYWGADYCDFLYDNGISLGYEDGTFRPDERLTRLQFTVMLYNALKLDPVGYVDVSLPFADLGSIPVEALPAVKALYKEGIVTGTTKDGAPCFDPSGSLTRAQAAAMIGRSQQKGYAAPELSFTDAASIPAYASFYVRTMVSQGILGGYADGTFRPQASITRGQMAKILYTLL